MALKKLFKLSIGLLFSFGMTVYLVFSDHGIVSANHQVSIKEVAAAKQTVKSIVNKLSGSNQTVEIALSQQDIDAVMSVASHVIESATFQSNLSAFGMTLNATIKVDYIVSTSYINLQCLLTPGFEKFEFDNCNIGSISVPGAFVEWSIKNGTHLIFGKEVKNTVAMLIDDAVLSNNKIVLKATKSDHFKQDIKDSLQGATQIVRSVFKKKQVDKQQVLVYLDYLNSLNHRSDSIAFYIGKLFAQVQQVGNIDDNSAALWALMIAYANPGFGQYIGINYRHSHPTSHITLRGRQDILLHFLYSAFLEQIGDGNIGVKIGEVKELFDSNKGGSGFSFADLAADKTGVKFAEILTDDDSAGHAVAMLANITQESVFFPIIIDLPEGFSEQAFNQQYGGVNAQPYQAMMSEIDARIARLPLY
ncbi:MAG: hypothetical protein HRU24_10085 [Gammaproteobacteria bacterium]|nr:hypothetical protein [Gammaproteobacteria bacterium]